MAKEPDRPSLEEYVEMGEAVVEISTILVALGNLDKARRVLRTMCALHGILTTED